MKEAPLSLQVDKDGHVRLANSPIERISPTNKQLTDRVTNALWIYLFKHFDVYKDESRRGNQ